MFRNLLRNYKLRYASTISKKPAEDVIAPVDLTEVPFHSFRDQTTEDVHRIKARLIYQSRKRGMLENGLLLSSFAAKYLDTMDPNQLHLYDRLINLPSNDWDLYYWATGLKPTPDEFQNEIMEMLQNHVKNSGDARNKQPDLY